MSYEPDWHTRAVPVALLGTHEIQYYTRRVSGSRGDPEIVL
jgi:hypothetical protein